MALQLVAMLGGGVAAAMVVDASMVSSATILALCLICGAQAGGTAIRPGTPRSGRMVPALAVPLAAVGTFLAFSGAADGAMRDAAAVWFVPEVRTDAVCPLPRDHGWPFRPV